MSYVIRKGIEEAIAAYSKEVADLPTFITKSEKETVGARKGSEHVFQPFTLGSPLVVAESAERS